MTPEPDGSRPASSWSLRWACVRLRGKRTDGRHLRWATTGALVVLLALTILLPFLLRWLQPNGKLNLGDRLRVWEAAMRVTASHPILGYGWGAVWPKGWESKLTPEQDTSVLTAIRRQSKVPASHGHNSVYDLLPQIGWLGVALFCLLVLAAISVGWRVTRAPGTWDSESQLVAG